MGLERLVVLLLAFDGGFTVAEVVGRVLKVVDAAGGIGVKVAPNRPDLVAHGVPGMGGVSHGVGDRPSGASLSPLGADRGGAGVSIGLQM